MACSGSCGSWVRAQDFFGYHINLNFDRNGDTHNTIIGGTFSIFIRCFIAWYVAIKCQKLITYDDDNMNYTESLINLNETEEISYGDTKFYFFGVLKNLNYQINTMNKSDQ